MLKLKFSIFSLIVIVMTAMFAFANIYLIYNFSETKNKIIEETVKENSKSLISLLKIYLEKNFGNMDDSFFDVLRSWIKNDNELSFVSIVDRSNNEVIFVYPDTVSYIIYSKYIDKQKTLKIDNIYINQIDCSTEKRSAEISIGYNLSNIYKVSENQYKNAQYTIFIAFFASIIILAFIARFITTPIRRLSKFADNIKSSKEIKYFDKDYHISEVDQLAESLNKMLTEKEKTKIEIENQNQALIKYNNTLKEEIKYRLKIEQEKESNQKLLDTIIDIAPAIIAFIDENNIYRISNRNHALVFNKSVEQIIGMTVEELIGAERAKMAISNFEESRRTGSTVSYYLPHKFNGKDLTYLSTVKALFDIDGNYKGVILISVDITESKEAEEKLKFSNTIFRIQQELSPDGIIIIDKEGELYSVNNRYYEIFDLNKYEIELKDFNDIEKITIPKIINRSNIINLPEYVRSKNELTSYNELHLDNGKIIIRYITPMLSVVGDYLGAILYLTDVTKERKMLAEKDAALERAEQSNKFKTEFLANMSHEIRTPLNAVIGFTQILTDRIKDEQNIFIINSINSSAKSLLNLINDILDLSKIEAGKFNIENSSTNIRNLVNEINNIFSYEVQRKGLELILYVDENVPSNLITDEVRLRQCLVNVIGNGIKFTDNGFVNMNVKVEKKDEDLSKVDLIFEIIDTGIGITENEYDKIFENFYQKSQQSNKKYGGTGLGLPITKKLLNLMNGDIRVRRNEPQGTIFTILLGSLHIASTTEEEENLRISKEFECEFKPIKILIVDDLPINRQLIREFLNYPEIKHYEAENGKEAIESIIQNKPDLVFMDIKMPVMTGAEAIKIIRSKKETSQIPIIALTASAMIGDKERLISDGFDSYIAKPIDKYKILIEIMNVLPNSIIVHRGFIKQAEVISKEESYEIISNEELKQKLRAEVLPNIIESEKSLIIGNIKKIVNQIEIFSKNYHNDSLKKISKELNLAVKNFDIIKIKELLSSFKNII